MSRCSETLAFTLFLSSLLFSLSAANDEVHKLLLDHGLPAGILPDAVSSFNISAGGDFSVELYGPCYIKFDYMVYYDRVISGNLKYGSITSLKGVQVQKFLLWLNVDEIRVDLPPSDYIYFHVGMINKKLDVKQFKKARSCRKPASFQEIWEVFTLLTFCFSSYLLAPCFIAG